MIMRMRMTATTTMVMKELDDYEKEDDHYENEDEEDSKMKTRKNLIYVKFYFKRYVIA